MEIISIVGAGWLGLALGKELVAKGHKVHGTTTQREKLPVMESIGMHPHLWNILKSREGELRFFDETDILVLSIQPGRVTGIERTKLRSFLAAVRHAGIRKLIYTSSTSVYAPEGCELREEDAVRVTSPHSGYYMLDMEDEVRNTLDLTPTILRFGGLFGPGRHPGSWMAGRKLAPGPDNPVNMIHLQDCIGIISMIIEKDFWGKTYNAVAPGHPSRRDFYAGACEDGGYEPPTWSEDAAPWKQVNSDKLITELGYTFVYPDPILAF